MTLSRLTQLASAMLSVVLLCGLVVQFQQIKALFGKSSSSLFEATVDGSYHLIDLSVNDSIHYYLKGIAETAARHLFESSALSSADHFALRETLSKIQVGETGYAYFVGADNRFIYHPYYEGESAAVTLDSDELANFVEYSWQNPDDEAPKAKVSYRILLDDGSRLGISAYKDELLQFVDTDALKTRLLKQQLGETTSIHILDRSGQVIFENGHVGVFKNVFTSLDMGDLIEGVKQGSFQIPSPQLDLIPADIDFTFRHYAFLDWVIIAAVETKELTSPVNRLIVAFAIAILCAVSIILALIIRLSRKHKKALELQKLDYLTGLRNRRSFMELVAPISLQVPRASDSSLYSVIMIDIDLFKAINDRYGHDHGDLAIHSLARVLLSHESKNIISGRYGGEEFIVFLRGTTQEEAIKHAELLRSEIEAIKGLKNSITASLGVYTCYELTVPFTQAVTYADLALYQAKINGRNRVERSNHA